jgi:hypothetical protein
MKSRNIESRLGRIETALEIGQPADRVSDGALAFAQTFDMKELLEFQRQCLAHPPAETLADVFSPEELKKIRTRVAAANLAPGQPHGTNDAD